MINPRLLVRKVTPRYKQNMEQAHKLFTQLDNASTKDVQDTASKAAKTASSISWWGFLGGLIGAIISSIFGYYGYRSRKDSFML